MSNVTQSEFIHSKAKVCIKHHLGDCGLMLLYSRQTILEASQEGQVRNGS